MPTLTPDEVHTILRSGDFAQLVGVIETDQFEAKAEPYADSNLGRLELAKDVSGLANATNGLIVIGARTERFPERQVDEIVEIRPLPLGLVNAEQYLALIRAWIHPPPAGVEVEWFPSREGADRGLVAISVPEQPSENWPHLIGHYVDHESGRMRDIVFGYAERVRAGIEPLTLRDLHGRIRDGRRFGEIGPRLDCLEAVVRERPLRAADVAAPPATSFPARRDAALEAAGLADQPTFTLAAVPSRAVEIPGMFRGPGAPAYELLNDPPELRDGSFKLSGPTPRIAGENLVRSLGREIVLELWSDGTLLGAGNAADFYVGVPAVAMVHYDSIIWRSPRSSTCSSNWQSASMR